MQGAIYFTAFVTATVGIWFVWDLGIRKLLLDGFRERLFELRFELFQLASSGQVSFDHEAYRAIELLISGLLRFAHRATLIGFAFSLWQRWKAQKANEYVDYHQQIELKISQTPAPVQEKMRHLLTETNQALFVYTVKSSIVCMAAGSLLIALKTFGLYKHDQRVVSAVFESEVYRAESQRGQLLAV